MTAGRRLRHWAALLGVAGAAMAAAPQAGLAAAPEVFFDDFSQADLPALVQAGWILRSSPGHPGVPGATWAPDGLGLIDDPQQPGNRLLRLSAQTDGTPAGTRQAQLCQARKFLYGTYAARLRFTDRPVAGSNGDPVIQTFYAVSPLRHDFDPQFSEVDWEYLPNGGWGSAQRRLYGISWQTVRMEPWQAHNAAQQAFGSFDGWHLLVMQVSPQEVRLLVDGQPFARHAGRNVPVVPMAIQFNLWFSPAGLLPPGGPARVWQLEVDWVFHAAQAMLSPEAVAQRVQAWRQQGVGRLDSVPAADPPLASPCDV